MFELESEMIAPLTESLPRLLIPEGPYVVACEVPDGARVIDIICASMPDSRDMAQAEGVANKLSRLSMAQTMVLALIWREKKVSASRLSAMTYVGLDELREGYLEPFCRAGLVDQEGRSWVVGSWGEARPGHLIAVEAKLTDWREAIWQAKDNRGRADYSYVALPKVSRRRTREELIKSAREQGVGVVELHPRGEAEIVLKARKTPSDVCIQKWQLAVRLLADSSRTNSRWTLIEGSAGA